MTSTLSLSGMAMLLVTSTAFAQALPTVKSVDVLAELESIENAQAAAYWAGITVDLDNAIEARLTNQMAGDGVTVMVDIEEVSLSNGFEEVFGLADTRLVGMVYQKSETDPSRTRSYEMQVDVNQSLPMMPADIDLETLPADTRVYYEAMINTFAQVVVDRLE